MSIVVLFLVAAAAVFAAVLLLLSPGKLRPILDSNGRPLPNSINEKVHVRINGVDQGMIIRSRDRSRPVLLFVHVYDYTVSHSQAKEYLARLKAPVKGFYTFAHSAHSPAFEEPERMRQILREDVLAGENRLADRA